MVSVVSGCQSTHGKGVTYYDSRCNGNFSVGEDRKSPIVWIVQRYPASAARNGFEGYVKIEFDISRKGQVINMNTIESSPSDIFVFEARRALSKWKYKPEIKNNKRVKTTCHMVNLSFNMNKK